MGGNNGQYKRKTRSNNNINKKKGEENMKGILGWIVAGIILFVAIGNNAFLSKDIKKLENEIQVCRDWNNIFLKVIIKGGDNE